MEAVNPGAPPTDSPKLWSMAALQPANLEADPPKLWPTPMLHIEPS